MSWPVSSDKWKAPLIQMVGPLWRRELKRKFTVPIRLTLKMWTLIRRRWYLGIYSQTLYVLFRDRWAHASKNKNNVVFIDFKCKGVPRSLSPAHFAFVQCSPIFQKKKKTTSVNRLEDKGKQHVQFLRHQNNEYIFYPAYPLTVFPEFPKWKWAKATRGGVRGTEDKFTSSRTCLVEVSLSDTQVHIRLHKLMISKAYRLHHDYFTKSDINCLGTHYII